MSNGIHTDMRTPHRTFWQADFVRPSVLLQDVASCDTSYMNQPTATKSVTRRQNFARWLKLNGLTSYKVATETGISRSTLTTWEQSPQGDTKASTEQTIADHYGVSVEDIFVTPASIEVASSNRSRPPLEALARRPISVPLCGDVQAGYFTIVIHDNMPSEFIEFYAPGLDRVTARAYRVRGRSMDKVFPEDSLVLVIDAAEMYPQIDDYVVIRRFDSEGKAETSLKQVRQGPAGIEFWPLSTQPEFQDPFIPEARDDAQQEGWEIIGVVYTYQPPRIMRSGITLKY